MLANLCQSICTIAIIAIIAVTAILPLFIIEQIDSGIAHDASGTPTGVFVRKHGITVPVVRNAQRGLVQIAYSLYD